MLFQIENGLRHIWDFVWGPAMMVAIIATGIYLSIGLRGITISRIPGALRLSASPQARGKALGTGEITPYPAQFGVPTWTAGIVIGLATFAVLIGGLKRIASISELLVPTMIIIFMGGGFLVLGMNIAGLPHAIVTRARLVAGNPLVAPAHTFMPSSPKTRGSK